MQKTSIDINRLSSITLLKIMLITGLFPWVLIDTGIILYHLITGNFVVDVTRVIGDKEIVEQVPIGKFILFSYPIVVLMGTLFVLLFWLPCAFSLWLWSKLRTMRITYYSK